jgi:glycosyltransferase involved in cell wall biosynthesis
MKRFYNSAMVRGDLVIANSLFTAKSIFAQHHFPPAKLKVIPRGADLKVFDPERVAPERIDVLEKAWNAGEATRVGPQTLKLLLPARMTFWKGQDVAIRAFTRLISGRSRGFPATGQSLPLRLVLAGDSQGTGDFARGLEREVDQRGVREMVTFVGHCADMPAAYLWADAVLSPATLPEAFGRVAVEAGAMARPVVASDLGGQKETVIDGATGLLVPAGDDEALADAIAELYAMGRQGRAAMGARARVHVAAHFSADAMRRATLEAYRDLLN